MTVPLKKESTKKKLPSEIPSFKSDDEIAAFMEKHSAFDLLDAGLAEIVHLASLLDESKRDETASLNPVVEKNKPNVRRKRR